MYRDSESYLVVLKILSKSVITNIALKWQKSDDVLIVMSQERKIFFLNEVAKDFLLLCNGKQFSEIVDELYEIYEVDKDILTDDLMDIIQDLQYKRILRVEAS